MSHKIRDHHPDKKSACVTPATAGFYLVWGEGG